MSKVHIELTMDKKQLLVAFLQDAGGNMDTYRKHVRLRNAFDLENFQLFCGAWRSELRIINEIVTGSGIDITLSMWHFRHRTYRSLMDGKEGTEGELPTTMQKYKDAAERTDYEVSLQTLKDLRSDLAKKDWNERRIISPQGKVEVVDVIVNMDEAQVIVEFTELLSDVLNVKEESESG